MRGNTTGFPNGISTAKESELFSEFIQADPTKVHSYFEDFDYYVAADWIVTEVGVATQFLADFDGGVLNLLNAAADDNSNFLQKNGESFTFETGKKVWFECRFQLSDAIESDCVIGLQITDTTPLSVTDGVFFRKNDGSGNIVLVVEKDSTGSISATIATLADATFVRLGFFYNGQDKFLVFADGVAIATVPTTNLPDDEVLTISFGLQNGEAAAKSMNIDYIFVAKER